MLSYDYDYSNHKIFLEIFFKLETQRIDILQIMSFNPKFPLIYPNTFINPEEIQ